MVNILSINSILVNTDIISDSYADGSTKPTIYSILQNVSPGFNVIEKLTYQTEKELNMSGENQSIRFNLREIKTILKFRSENV